VGAWETQEAGGVACVIRANQQDEEWAHLFLLVSVPRFSLAGLGTARFVYPSGLKPSVFSGEPWLKLLCTF
jgi:hypothetical protein